MAALEGVIATAGWLAFPTTNVACAEPTSPEVSVAVALSVAAPAAPKTYETLSESAGLEGLESESIRTHVPPLYSESVSYVFGAAGAATLRATATDTSGLVGSAQATFVVGRASQPAVAITPSSAAITAGQSVGFAASGGTTG